MVGLPVRSLSFYVPGIPAPKGSKTPWGTEANPRTRPWMAVVADAAAQRMNGQPLMQGPLALAAEFEFVRPKSHYRTGRNADQLRATAPVWHEQTPDADKLARAIGDALAGVCFRDDRQIAMWEISKRWGESAGMSLQVWQLNEETTA